MSLIARVIDIGNTAIKVALFRACDDEPVVEKFSLNNIAEAKNYLSHSNDLPTIVSNVNAKNIVTELLSENGAYLLFTNDTIIPLYNRYQTPLTLGLDRLANAVGAASIFPSENVLCIDFGTCIKYDFVSANNEYLGGAIGPGLTMRFKALHTFTANLPLIEHCQETDLIGSTTHASILTGCYNGMKHEVIHTIQEYNQRFDHLRVLLTGGEMEHFSKLAFSEKNSIFADPFLTLKGLNTILLANV
jgi:type III pantothenate kinase